MARASSVVQHDVVVRVAADAGRVTPPDSISDPARTPDDRFGLWTRQAGADSVDVATGVATDANGNVYVVGWTYDVVNQRALPNDVFLAKFDASGVNQWSRSIGASDSDDYPTGVVVDANGHVIVGSQNQGNITLSAFDASGAALWTYAAPGSGYAALATGGTSLFVGGGDTIFKFDTDGTPR